jgi:SpoVK/Ycf46/Vps4 family AAA+-type ATPase
MIGNLASGNPLIWVDTIDYERASAKMTDGVNKYLCKPVYRWDVVSGIIDANTLEVKEESTGVPTQPIEFLKNATEPCVMQVFDFHKYIAEIEIWRFLLNELEKFKLDQKSFINISPLGAIPTEISRYLTVVNFPLPTETELFEKTKSIVDSLDISEDYSEEELRDIARSAIGLTEYELENALSLGCAVSDRITKEYVSEQRFQMVKKLGTLEILESKEGFEAVIGLDRLKHFCKKMITSKKGRGVLLLGHPGAGKSHFAKCLGNEANRPTVILDLGKLMGSLVGQTEQKTDEALKTIDAMGECVVFIDELEKALSGTRSTGNDTSVRQGGKVLQWLSDKDSNSFIVATANKIEDLPPEFLRAERWDAIFFIDFPNEDEAAEMLAYYCKMFGVEVAPVAIPEFTGAEIKSICRISSSMEISLEEAKQYINPVSVVNQQKVVQLREWAKNRCVNASSNSNAAVKEEDHTNNRKVVKVQ